MISDWNEYLTILADPPWLERGGGKIKRGADRHYPLMTKIQIIDAMRTADCWRPARDCHLYLWVTNNFLFQGLDVMTFLGFRYITTIVWVKDRIGLGQYFRGKSELLLFGVRGKTMLPMGKKWSTVILAPRRRHSQKPELSYQLIEETSPAPRLEMFAREPREGWDVWGNEV